MRTALVLLFLLALAAVPGSLLPQRPLNPAKVVTTSPRTARGGVSSITSACSTCSARRGSRRSTCCCSCRWSAAWSRASGVHARAMLAKPLRAPKNLDRLPESGRFESGDTAGGVRPRGPFSTRAALAGRAARRAVRGDHAVGGEGVQPRDRQPDLPHRAAVRAHPDRGRAALQLPGVGDRAAGAGLLQHRHVLRLVAAGPACRRGQGFARAVLHRQADKFTAQYLPDGEPSKFAAAVTYSLGTDGSPKHKVITVNHPLRLEGDRVYLIGHGFAPQITVRMPDGSVRHDQACVHPVAAGDPAVRGRVPGAGQAGREAGHRHRRLLRAHPGGHGQRRDHVDSPAVSDPVLGIFVYQGTVNPNGQPQSVYSLNKAEAAPDRSGEPAHRPDERGCRTGSVSRSTAGCRGRACRFRTTRPRATC